tara:strand:- start:256 stop:939 length:684 start_codon:yes stop_codon:yes gene_type:complete
MKFNNSNIKSLENEKQILDDKQYQLDKEIEWEKDKTYVLTQVTEKLAFDMKRVEEIAESISDRRVASRLLSKLIERNMEYHIHKEYFTTWHKTPEGGYHTGRYLCEFDIDKARNGIHIFGQVRLNKSADRKLDFVLISKKDDFIKKFVVECQTNLGHLKPMENHRDCVLAREITLRTDFVFLPYSSREIFWDSHISSLDELVDELEFGNNSKIYNNRNNLKDTDIPF